MLEDILPASLGGILPTSILGSLNFGKPTDLDDVNVDIK